MALHVVSGSNMNPNTPARPDIATATATATATADDRTATAAESADESTTGEPSPKRRRSELILAGSGGGGGSGSGGGGNAGGGGGVEEEGSNSNIITGINNSLNNGIPASQRLYSCGKCSKSYTRLDHLSRHVRMHTQEKPYQCHICTKAFARADLLKRHALGHAKDDPHAKPTIVQHSRVSQACEACAGLREFLVFWFTSLHFTSYFAT